VTGCVLGRGDGGTSSGLIPGVQYPRTTVLILIGASLSCQIPSLREERLGPSLQPPGETLGRLLGCCSPPRLAGGCLRKHRSKQGARGLMHALPSSWLLLAAHGLWPPVTHGGLWFLLWHTSTALPGPGCIWAAVLLIRMCALCWQRKRQPLGCP